MDARTVSSRRVRASAPLRECTIEQVGRVVGRRRGIIQGIIVTVRDEGETCSKTATIKGGAWRRGNAYCAKVYLGWG